MVLFRSSVGSSMPATTDIKASNKPPPVTTFGVNKCKRNQTDTAHFSAQISLMLRL